jgi:hypothetical protein
MILAEFDFSDTSAEEIVSAALSLPSAVRPTHFGDDETNMRRRKRIDDQSAYRAFFGMRESGFFLFGPCLVCVAFFTRNRSFRLSCSIETSPDIATQFFHHMLRLKPAFAFACLTEEREQRNRFKAKLRLPSGGNISLEAWVGRDLERYIPGLYWLTLLPSELADRHDVSLSFLSEISVEATFNNGLNVFRFYDAPESWRSAVDVARTIASSPGIFNIARLVSLIPEGSSYESAQRVLSDWK